MLDDLPHGDGQRSDLSQHGEEATPGKNVQTYGDVVNLNVVNFSVY